MLKFLKTRLRKTRLLPYLWRLRKILFYLEDGIMVRRRGSPGFCHAPWKESAVLCDGTVVCSCFDARKTMPLGNAEDSSFLDIWRGRRYQRLRAAVKRGTERVFLCSQCVFQGSRPDAGQLERSFPLKPDSYPTRLHIEPTIRCNLSCPGCDNQSTRLLRTRHDMPFDAYRTLVEEVGPYLNCLGFYDYGEPLLHPRALEMLAFAKQVNPKMEIWCSTNGHFLRTAEQQRALIDSGVDQLIFSVDGASQKVYEKYRVGGHFDLVLENMRNLMTKRREMGRSKPFVTWRYILFNWNDSEEEMNRARALAREIKVDRFCWMLTTIPRDGWSRRFAPGSEELERIRHELF